MPYNIEFFMTTSRTKCPGFMTEWSTILPMCTHNESLRVNLDILDPHSRKLPWTLGSKYVLLRVLQSKQNLKRKFQPKSSIQRLIQILRLLVKH